MGSGNFRLLAGLGNPGSRYLRTRHNIGFMAVEKIASKNGVLFNMNKKLFGHVANIGIGESKKRLLMPNTYMNESGRSISAAMEWFDLETNQLLVLVDDMDLPLGKLRLREDGGSGGHNGLKDIITNLGRKDFCRLRIGIGAPSSINSERKQKTIPHVLGRFNNKEDEIVEEVLDKVIKGLELIEDLGLTKGITYLNSYKPNIEI